MNTHLDSVKTHNGIIDLHDHNGMLELIPVGSDGDYASLTVEQAKTLIRAISAWIADESEEEA